MHLGVGREAVALARRATLSPKLTHHCPYRSSFENATVFKLSVRFVKSAPAAISRNVIHTIRRFRVVHRRQAVVHLQAVRQGDVGRTDSFSAAQVFAAHVPLARDRATDDSTASLLQQALRGFAGAVLRRALRLSAGRPRCERDDARQAQNRCIFFPERREVIQCQDCHDGWTSNPPISETCTQSC